MKFVDVKNDVAFRKIFGNEARKKALISFLNAILNFEGEKKITDVTIINPIQLPKIREGKTTIIDVKAKDQRNNEYIIEMQVADVESFDKRVLYYTSKSFTDQIERGDLYNKLNPIIFIGILNFIYTQSGKYLTKHRILEVETGENYLQNIEYNFIELPKFDKKIEELITLTDKWVYFIKNAESLEVVPANTEDEGLKTAYAEADKFNWTKAELEDYDYAFMREQDEVGRIEKAIKNQKLKTAGELKKLGLETDKIIQATGLTKMEIDTL